MLQVLPAKTPTEAKVVTFDFANVVSGTINTPTVAKATLVGTDPAAAGLTLSAPSVSGTDILVLVSAGLNNCTYSLICTVNDSGGQVHQDGASLTTTTDAA